MKRTWLFGFTGIILVSALAGGAVAATLGRSTISSAAEVRASVKPEAVSTTTTNPPATNTPVASNPPATNTPVASNPSAANQQQMVADNNAVRVLAAQRKERERIAEEQRQQAEAQRVQREQVREQSRMAVGTAAGVYTTNLGSHNDANRVHNIKLALASINKTVLLPGETFSFHGAIGDSTNGKLGYKTATVIVGKEYATDYGGGICQVSSTLYNAVARAKLQVTERHSHSLSVDYVPKGQDATVSFPDLDFKFVNTSSSPVRIDASLQGDKVNCTIVTVKAN